MHEAPQEQMLQDTNPSGIKTRVMDIRNLTPHPRNNEFFDDIEGEKWDEFKENIRQHGLYVPILVTTEGVIVSGHQRVRACKELEMWSVPVNIKHFPDEDAVLRALIETNTVQRGTIVNQSKRRQSAIIRELERLYKIGVNGGDRKSKNFSAPNGELILDEPSTQQELAEKLGVSTRQYSRLKSLSNLLPELYDVLEENEIPQNYLYQIALNFPEHEQSALLQKMIRLPGYKKHYKDLVQYEVKQALKEHDASLDETNAKLQHDLEEARRKTDEEKNKNNKLRLEKIRMEEELATSRAMLAERPQEMENMEETNRQLFNQLTEERNGRRMIEQANRQLKEQLESKNVAIESILAFRVSIENAVSALQKFYQDTGIAEEYILSMQQELALARHNLDQFVTE